MMLLTKDLKVKLLANGKATADALNADDSDGTTPKHSPVVKFFNPMGAGTWLFTELDEDGDTLFGLCDLGMQCPEMGYASLSEIESIDLQFGMKIERDRHFTADKTLVEYADEARVAGGIRV